MTDWKKLREVLVDVRAGSAAWMFQDGGLLVLVSTPTQLLVAGLSMAGYGIKL